MNRLVISIILFLCVAWTANAQVPVPTTHDRAVEVGTSRVGESNSNLRVEVGPTWVVTGGTKSLTELIPVDPWKLPRTMPMASFFNYLQSDTIDLQEGRSEISFTWRFNSYRLERLLRPDSLVRITYEICDAQSGTSLHSVLQTVIGVGAPVYDTLSGGYVHAFNEEGIRVFEFDSHAGERVVTKCRFNLPSLLASIDSADYQFLLGFIERPYPDTLNLDTLGSVMTNIITGIDEPAPAAKLFSLEQNYPNPFNPTTAIRFVVRGSGFVSLKVYDILGRDVAALVNARLNAGYHSVTFNGRDLPSGVYFYQLISGNFVETKKMILLRSHPAARVSLQLMRTLHQAPVCGS